MTPFRKSQIALAGSLVILAVLDYFLIFHWLFYLLPLVVFTGFLIGGSSILSLNFFINAFTHPNTTHKEIALTFDDGPHANTLLVLDVLKAYNTVATFFCIGENIKKHPKIMERIVAEGHTVGNHSYSHSNMFSLTGRANIIHEIEKTNTLITKYTQRENDLFRPPFGVINPPIAKAAKATGQKLIGWNLRTYDTTTNDAEVVVNKVKDQLKPGTVLLLHDNRPATAETLEAILQYAKANDYSFVDVRSIFNLEKS